MTDGQKSVFEGVTRWGSFLTPIGMVVLLVMQAQFVSRKEFVDATEKTDNRVQKVEIALVQLVEQNKVNDRQDTQIVDHERRIRDLEHFHPVATH
jgi:hypothetical protein